jgi:hypothetical protein
MENPITVTATPTSGQVTVQPRSRTVSGTSAVMSFQVTTKQNSGSVKFDSPCGSQIMQVVVVP